MQLVDINALTYSAVLESTVTYRVSVSGVNDYEISSGGLVFADGTKLNVAQNIVLVLKPVYEVSGKFIGLTETHGIYETLCFIPESITFTNVEDGYSYNGTAVEGCYSSTLRDGSYIVSISDRNYETSNHIVVSGGTVTKDVLCEYIGEITPVEYVSDIYVGVDKEYKTVGSAINAVKAMGKRGRDKRVNIHIEPGTYRESITIDVPYVTFKSVDPKKEVTLTWYYGVGYKYYSCHNGYYDPYYEYDRYEKGEPTKWGASVYIKESAIGFKAENVNFESSFNKYMTDEEIADGVEPVEGKPARTISSKVTDGSALERASAVAIESDDNEFYKCNIIGCQHTLYTGGKNYDSYFRDCTIIGQVDYIYGDGNCVFDNCELRWSGFTGGAKGGYITAAKDTAKFGYLFRGCIISGEDMTNKNFEVIGGAFGRTWGTAAKVAFIDTKLAKKEYIGEKHWESMGNNNPGNANFVECNTILEGIKVSGDDNIDRMQYNAYMYLNGFKPEHLSMDLGTVPQFKIEPYITSNGDMNIPTIGNTFYVNYDLGPWADTDSSTVSWYRIKDGRKTLIKTGSMNTCSTYQAQPEDADSVIKVYVKAMTLDGKTGEIYSRETEKLGSTWVDPSNPNAPKPGKGINIFLAGDSTVKDYSSKGMYMGGKIEDKGSWGEFLQEFFNSDYVTVLNYANGGRSTRNFMNEGSLARIESEMSEGDYLFIQFGGNDAANQSGMLADRFVTLGEPDANGIFPIEGPKDDSFHGGEIDEAENIIKGNLTYDCGATFKWYLKQYAEAARRKGATPILVSSVVRNVFDANGKIKPHLDSTDTTTGTYVSSNNGYYRAYQQIAEEEGILMIDLFDITTVMLEDSYAADPNVKSDKKNNKGLSSYADIIFCGTDGTHRSKTGGVLEAGRIAQTIQGMNLSITPFVKAPSSCEGLNNEDTIFTISRNGQFTAKDNSYMFSRYWTDYGQNLFDQIKITADKINNGSKARTETSVTIQNDICRAVTRLYNISDGKVYIAAYDVTGRLIDVNIAEIGLGNVVSEFSLESTAELKIFVWDKNQNPIAAPEYKTINKGEY